MQIYHPCCACGIPTCNRSHTKGLMRSTHVVARRTCRRPKPECSARHPPRQPTQSDGRTAEQRHGDERALLTRLRFRFARLPVTAPGQQVQQQTDQRHDEQRSWYRRQYSQTLCVKNGQTNTNRRQYGERQKTNGA